VDYRLPCVTGWMRAIAITVLIAGTGVMDGIAGCSGAIFEPYFEVDVVWDWHGEFDPEQAGVRRS
jgi:hypothetical protein